MYLPRNLLLCEPHVFTWIGASGKRYEFAVSRPAASWLDQAAVFVLVRREGQEMKVLFVGHACSLHQQFGDAGQRCPEIWRRALAAGMTHVHLRFEACSERERSAEVRDLRAALRPTLEEAREPERTPPDRAAEEVDARSTTPDDVLVPYRARLKPTRHRDPHVDVEAFQVDPLRVHLPLGHAFEAPRLQRADPAREAFDEEAPQSGDAVLLWQSGAGEPETMDPPASIAVPLKEEVSIEPPSRSDAEAEAALVKIPSDADDSASPLSVDLPAASSRPSVPFIPPHQRPGIFSRLVSIAATRGRHWISAVSRRMDVKSLVAPALPESGLVQDAQSVEHAGPRDRDESKFVLGIPEVPPTTGSAVNSSSVVVMEETIAAEPDEPATTWVNEVEEQAPAALEVEEEPALPAEAAAAPAIEAATTVASRESIGAVKRGLDLEPAAPLVLFAGALSYEAGADIFADALITVCSGDASAQFVFVGEGPLRGDLEGRLHWAGLGGRCRFVGHAPAERFEQLLEACNFVVIPARVPQGEELARQALAFGKPVLLTHQSGIQCVEHGKTGLITYDNPGSFVWGIREILGPLGAKLGRVHAEAA